MISIIVYSIFLIAIVWCIIFNEGDLITCYKKGDSELYCFTEKQAKKMGITFTERLI